jgi:son of sevenless-like protein
MIDNKLQDKRKYLKKGYFSLFDWSVVEIGEELIRVTKKFLSKIQKRELYRSIYIKKDKEKTSPNVIGAINQFNNLISFIIEDILSYDNVGDRVKIIDKWCQIAQYCKDQKDFNDCLAITTAFGSYILKGLNLTNRKLRSPTLNLMKTLSKFCSCEENFKNMREEIKKITGIKDFFYPFLGLMLRDITFYEESSQYLIEGILINFEKMQNINNLLENSFRFKNEDNNNSSMYIEELSFFEKLEKNSEEYLESLAKEIEPKFIRNKGKKNFKKKTKVDKQFFNPNHCRENN